MARKDRRYSHAGAQNGDASFGLGTPPRQDRQSDLSTADPALVGEQLDRMLGAQLFRRSERMSRFLGHVVRAGLAGRGELLKEYAIGLDVFDKGTDFDPRTDPIVRVEAGRLRHKIREYYETTGKDDPIWLGLSRRGYRPRFRTRGRKIPPQRSLGGPERNQELGAASGPIVTVLPFADTSADAAQKYLCQALTDQVENAIARTQRLRILSRTSPGNSSSAADPDVTLEGSVQQAGQRVRVRVQLINVSTGLDIWADTYEREIGDGFETQDDLTARIVRSLQNILLGKQDQTGRVSDAAAKPVDTASALDGEEHPQRGAAPARRGAVAGWH